MCRNHKHSYTAITDKQRAKPREDSHSQCYKENKIPRHKTNKGCKGHLQGDLQTTAQESKKGHKQMDKHSVFMVRKNQYRENGHTAHSNL